MKKWRIQIRSSNNSHACVPLSITKILPSRSVSILEQSLQRDSSAGPHNLLQYGNLINVPKTYVTLKDFKYVDDM